MKLRLLRRYPLLEARAAELKRSGGKKHESRAIEASRLDELFDGVMPGGLCADFFLIQ